MSQKDGPRIGGQSERIAILKDQAAHLIQLGYAVIQTGADGDPKRPLQRGWNQNPATDPKVVESWFWPNEEGAGIAIVPMGRVLGIDIDAPKEEADGVVKATLYYNQLLKAFPELANAWRERTPSGGYHIVVRVGPDVNAAKLKKENEAPYGVKIELKGWQKKALTVAPTTLGKSAYQTIHGPVSVGGLPEMGRAFFEYIGALPRTRTRSRKFVIASKDLQSGLLDGYLNAIFELIENTQRGERNTNVFRAFFQLGRVKSLLGEDFERVKKELYELTKNRLIPTGFPLEEINTASQRGLSYGEKAGPPQLLRPVPMVSINASDIADLVWGIIAGDVKYLEDLEEWLVWNGRYWMRMPPKVGIKGLIIKVLREYQAYWESSLNLGDADINEWFLKLKRTCNRMGFVKEVEEYLFTDDKYGLRISTAALPKPWETGHLLPVANGVIDLYTGEISDHETHKDKMFFGVLDTAYNPIQHAPSIAAPNFMSALKVWSAGDEEWMDYLQWVLGSCLTGDTSAQQMYILYGRTANGKSTLLNIIAEILQDYAVRVAPDLFKKHKRDHHPTMYMDLLGKRFAYLPDLPEGVTLDEEIVKTQTGDRLRARPMRMNYIEFYTTHKAVIAANALPKIQGSKDAMFRRVIPIPFRVSFEKSQRRDPHFADKLRREKAGILVWLVAGAKAYFANPNRRPPKAIGDLWEAYKRSEDIVAQFIDACIEMRKGAIVSRADVYSVFQTFCKKMGIEPMKATSFTRRFRQILQAEEGFAGGARGYKDIAIRPDWEVPEEHTFFEEKNADELDMELFATTTHPELPFREFLTTLKEKAAQTADLAKKYLEVLSVVMNQGVGNGHSDRSDFIAEKLGETAKGIWGLYERQIILAEKMGVWTDEAKALSKSLQNDVKQWVKGIGETLRTGNPPDTAPHLLIKDPAALEAIVEAVQKEDAIGFDIETTIRQGLGLKEAALHPSTGQIRIVSLYLPKAQKAYVIDLFAVPDGLRVLKGAKKLIGHNLVFELAFLAEAGIYIDKAKERLWDTRMAWQLLQAAAGGNLKEGSLAALAKEIGIPLDKTYQQADWGGELTPEMIAYAAKDAEVPYRLYEHQKPQIEAQGLAKAMAIEMGALPMVALLRGRGVGADAQTIAQIKAEVETQIKELEASLETYWKGVCIAPNLNSQKDVLAILKALGIHLTKTSEDELSKYSSHPFVKGLLEWRGLQKRKQLIEQWEKKLQGDRIYADWQPIGAGTGRMACEKPNLQQVPTQLRRGIVPRKGAVLVKADFSQIELRIAAAIAKEGRMLEAFEKGVDLHKLTASMVLNKPMDTITKDERQIAKALNFGLLYGMGAEGLQRVALTNYGVDLDLKTAEQYRKAFFRTYPALNKWHWDTKAELEKRTPLLVSTLTGRKRLVKDRNAALNTPVQGTGADGLKASLALFYNWLLSKQLIDQVYPVLVVHDEIVVEAPTHLAFLTAYALTDCMRVAMQAMVQGKVPIEVEAGIYTDWGITPHPLNELWVQYTQIPQNELVKTWAVQVMLDPSTPDPDPQDAGDYYTFVLQWRGGLQGIAPETPPF